MRMTGTPEVLAKRSRAEAHSRTWAMLPALDSTSSVAMVCMESMTTRSGCTSLMWSNTSSKELEQRMSRWSLSAGLMRAARIFSWWALSSPLT